MKAEEVYGALRAYINASLKGVGILKNISVNGVTQTIADGAVDLDVATNLITETQWTSISAILD